MDATPPSQSTNDANPSLTDGAANPVSAAGPADATPMVQLPSVPDQTAAGAPSDSPRDAPAGDGDGDGDGDGTKPARR